MSLPEGATVHIFEADNTKAPIIGNRVLVNGIDVGLMKSFAVCPGGGGEGVVLAVTLELLPRQVIIGGTP
jgi:hypothetical protein